MMCQKNNMTENDPQIIFDDEPNAYEKARKFAQEKKPVLVNDGGQLDIQAKLAKLRAPDPDWEKSFGAKREEFNRKRQASWGFKKGTHKLV